MRDLGTLVGQRSWASAINGHGWVVGYGADGRGRVHAWLWREGRMQLLPPLAGYPDAWARAINDRGQVVGEGCSLHGAEWDRARHALLWEKGRVSDLNVRNRSVGAGTLIRATSIDNQGQVLGATTDGAFLWQGGEAQRVPGSYRAVWRRSATGQAALGKPGGDLWVVRQSGRECAPRLGVWGGPLATNDRGVAVGTTLDAVPGGADHAALFCGGKCLDLNRIRRSGSSMRLGIATGINNRGQIVGNGTIHGKTHAFLLSGVREAQPPPGGNRWP